MASSYSKPAGTGMLSSRRVDCMYIFIVEVPLYQALKSRGTEELAAPEPFVALCFKSGSCVSRCSFGSTRPSVGLLIRFPGQLPKSVWLSGPELRKSNTSREKEFARQSCWQFSNETSETTKKRKRRKWAYLDFWGRTFNFRLFWTFEKSATGTLSRPMAHVTVWPCGQASQSQISAH